MPIEAFADTRLTLRHLRLLGAISGFADSKGECWPKRDTLSKITGFPLTRISQITTELVNLGWLQKEGNGGRSSSCKYRITIPETVTKLDTVLEPKTVTKPVTDSYPQTVTESVTNGYQTGNGLEGETVTDLVTKTVTDLVTGNRTDQGTDQRTKTPVVCVEDISTTWCPEDFQPTHTTLARLRRAGTRIPTPDDIVEFVARKRAEQKSLTLDGWQELFVAWMVKGKKFALQDQQRAAASPGRNNNRPDWAKIPRADDPGLPGWAKTHGYPDAYVGETAWDYRTRLQQLADKRMSEGGNASA